MAAGGGPIDPDPALGHAANFLYMLTGQRPSALAARAFDVSLVLHADHELNASTFAARVAAATLTDIHSAIVARDRRAEGPAARRRERRRHEDAARHRQGRRAERAEDVRARASSRARRRSPGFGHRVYRTEDPRATHLRRFSKLLGEKAGQPQWFEMSQRIEAVVKTEKKLYPNVDFYSASMFYSLGHPDRSLHADLRRQPHLRLDGARARAVREQPAHPAAHRLHRPAVPADSSCRSSRDSHVSGSVRRTVHVAFLDRYHERRVSCDIIERFAWHGSALHP